uniref:Uncharacterized protein n=1 Tax=viral metagenome TaxID=1070528 RepID=A0A6C0E5Y9_9ZZZZ
MVFSREPISFTFEKALEPASMSLASMRATSVDFFWAAITAGCFGVAGAFFISSSFLRARRLSFSCSYQAAEATGATESLVVAGAIHSGTHFPGGFSPNPLGTWEVPDPLGSWTSGGETPW